MKNKLKRAFAALCAITAVVSFSLLTACGNNDDNVGDDGSDVSIVSNVNDGDSVGNGGNSGDAAAGSIQSTFSEYPDSKDALIASIKTHTTETATYKFEAECTDLSGKSGPGWSGETSGTSMAVGIFDGERSEGCISYLYDAGNTVNFLVVCDRDVEDAVLSFRLGAEHMDLPVTGDAFTIRVDTVAQQDLYSVKDDGAIGSWDLAFLGYYPAGYYISTFECPADSVISSKEANGPSNFADYLITSKLSLKEGVNSISIIVTGMPLDADMDGKTTMRCKAPCIDNMTITTSAQLGFFNQQNNGYGTDGLEIIG